MTTDQTYTIETTGVADSTPIYWRVRTKGAIEEWGDWSVERAVMVYNPPSIVMTLTPGATVETTEDPNSFEKYPIKVSLFTETENTLNNKFILKKRKAKINKRMDNQDNIRRKIKR